MKFKKITLENFRQFRGNQTIVFSEDKVRNVTVVVGNNGLGKTTLLQSFRWCLYNDIKLENKEMLYNIEDFQNLKDGEITLSYVEIEIEKDDEIYTIRRTREYQKKNGQAKCLSTLDSKPLVTVKNSTGVTKSTSETDIEKLLPQELSPYFFFDGERMKNLSENSEDGKRDVSNAVKGMFGLNIYEKVIGNLDTIEKQYSSKLRINGYHSKEMIDIQERIVQTEDSINDYERQNRNHEAKIQKLESDIQIIDRNLSDSKVIKEMQSMRLALEGSIKSIREQQKREQRLILENYVKNIPFIKLSSRFDEIRQIIRQNEIMMNASIEGISGHAIDQILNRKQCICGQIISVGDSHYNNLVEIKKYLPPESLSTLLKKMDHQFSQFDFQNIESIQQIELKIDNYYKSTDEFNSAVLELETVNQKIKMASQSASEIERMELNRAEYKESVITLREKKGANLQLIKMLSKNLANNKVRRNELSLLENSNNETLKVIDTTKRVKDKIAMDFKNLEMEVRNRLQVRVQNLMNEMLETKREVKIEDGYRFTVKDVYGNTAMGEGYKVVTSFSYIGGILAIAKEINLIETDCYPLVMDAPYANLDYTNRKTVNAIIPEIAEQMILFTTDSQWEGSVQDGLTQRVGRAYKLFHNIDTANLLKDGDTKILEVTYDISQ